MADSISSQLKKGVLELCALALLSECDHYGYDIARQLADGVGMGEGTTYPLMRRLQTDGHVSTYLQETSNGPPRKYYRITASGRETLQRQKQEWHLFAGAVSRIIGEA